MYAFDISLLFNLLILFTIFQLRLTFGNYNYIITIFFFLNSYTKNCAAKTILYFCDAKTTTKYTKIKKLTSLYTNHSVALYSQTNSPILIPQSESMEARAIVLCDLSGSNKGNYRQIPFVYIFFHKACD